jgi:uncharacterized protein (TIGR02600 family)
MVTGNFSETNFAPPSTWKSSPAIYCDLNAPVTRAGNSTSLAYPIADPSVAGAVPGFTINGTAPGYSGSNPSPTNNPLPMPVRWLYVLKNGQLTTPSSVDAGGNVTFTSSDPQPSTTNPVVGRIAFWADDETCKVNINTAGYAKNDSAYWTYWDAPNLPTKDEFEKLNVQPWTNEFLRYPGHPATTGLNLVFEGVSLTSNQIASLTPRYNDGGTLGGTNMANSANATALPIKTARLFPTVDEMFYNPARGAAATGISSDILEARRFFLTATSRAPETTLLDTPKTTLWPVWQIGSGNRTATDKLIAFCSTIGNGTSEQPFYFVRANATRTDELTAITQNSKLYSYLQTITNRNLPGVGTTSFKTKYASQPASIDQILTSFFDAIRLTNLYDQSTGATRYTNANPGWVNSTIGPNGTFSLGRNPTLEEVNIVFTGGMTSANATVSKFPICYMYYSLNIPAAGSVMPAQNFRMEVSGLNQFTANSTQIFPFNTWENSMVGTGVSAARRSGFGGRISPSINSATYGIGDATLTTTITTKTDGVTTNNGNMPFTSAPLTSVPYTAANQTFPFGGGNLTIRLYAPATSTTPYHTFAVNIPNATVLTPLWTGNVSMTDTTSGYKNTTQYYWNNTDRWGSNGYFQLRAIDMARDTVLGVATSAGDIRSRAIRQTFTAYDFNQNLNYGNTTTRLATTIDQAGTSFTINTTTRAGRPIKLFSAYDDYAAFPQVPSGVFVDTDFPGAGDWDNGIGGLRDGSYSPKADEGLKTVNLNNSGAVAGDNDYFYQNDSSIGSVGIFSPNRQVPSAAIYGNLPTGTWRTLLFRPDRTYHRGANPTVPHFGSTTPPDMYLLDFFHMPVVEPYAISEPFSTAGKINMNAQMIPFSGYITRETGLRAVLASTRLTAYNSAVNLPTIPPTTPTPVGGMCNSAATTLTDVQTRFPLNLDETIKGFRDRYDGTDAAGRRVFVSPAEICSLDLVPDTSGANAALFSYGTVTKATLASFWAKNLTTGDNSRERPYAHLLPRLTTRSNSYTVHVTAQALAPGPGATGWQEGKGKVLSEWRGSYTIERYVDPNDARFTGAGAPDFLSGTQPVGPFYRFRVLGTRRFNP